MEAGDSVTHTLCCFDPSSEYFAAVSHDGIIKIWNIAADKSFQLKQKSHLQAKFTCLVWNKTSSLIAAGTQSGNVICWNVKKATEVFQWKNTESSSPIYDLVFTSSNTLFICGAFPHIVHVDTQNKQLIRKIKADKKKVTKIKLSSDESHLISAGSSYIKIWDLSSDKAINKFSSFTDTISELELTWIDEYLLFSSVDQRKISLFPINEENPTILQTFSCERSPTAIKSFYQKTESNKKRKKRKTDQNGAQKEVSVPISIQLLAVQAHTISIWQFGESMKANKPLSADCNIYPESESELFTFLSAEFLSATQILVASGSLLKPKFEKITFKKKTEIIKRITVEVQAPHLLVNAESAASIQAKDKAGRRDVNVVSDLDTHIPARPKQDSTNNNKPQQSLQEALEQIEVARKHSNTSSSKQKTAAKATSDAPVVESVHVGLLQAIQSDDSQLLDSCLKIHDPEVIHKTVERLPNDFVLQFLNNIIVKLQTKPSHAGQLIPWIKSVVMLHTPYLMTLPDLNATGLVGLYQSIDSRLGSFDKLLKLSGRLDLVTSQVNFRESQYRANITPATATSIDEVFDEEEDENEEEEDEEMNVGSDADDDEESA